VPDGVSTPSGSEFKLGADDGGDEDNRRPNIVPEVRNSKKRTKAKPTLSRTKRVWYCGHGES